MQDILQTIIDTKREELERLYAPKPSLRGALMHSSTGIIAEFKRRSPSKGWIKYTDVDFSCLYDGYMQVNVKAADDTELCIREKSPSGKVIARIKLAVRPPEPTPGAAANPMMARFRRDLRNQWLTQTTTMEYTPKGVADLVITNEGGGRVECRLGDVQKPSEVFQGCFCYACKAR